MARNITNTQLQPILNILDIKRIEELNSIDNSTVPKALRIKEVENRKLMQPVKARINEVNKLIEDINKEINAINDSVGDCVFANVSELHTYESTKYYKDNTKKDSNYNSNYYAVSDNQIKEADIEVENARRRINMKYEIIKAKIMLAGDFNDVAKVLEENGISLMGDIQDKAE
jgi:glutathionyl-hydroquinone reductase